MKMNSVLKLKLLLVLIFFPLAARAVAQQDNSAATSRRCPKPRNQTLTISAPQSAVPYVPDFPNHCSNGFEPKFGGTHIDKCLRHTFSWKQSRSCENDHGTLTIKYKALFAGPHYADNDTVALYSNGSVVPGTSQPLYSGTAVVGLIKTKSIPLTAAMLANNRVSFLVQDDTSVLSATLNVVQCCR